jgi:hypothetical protein
VPEDLGEERLPLLCFFSLPLLVFFAASRKTLTLTLTLIHLPSAHYCVEP